MRARPKSDVAEPLDPIAFTLAVWLGLIVCVTGFIRVSDQAADRAALAKSITGSTEEGQAFSPGLIAFGG